MKKPIMFDKKKHLFTLILKWIKGYKTGKQFNEANARKNVL